MYPFTHHFSCFPILFVIVIFIGYILKTSTKNPAMQLDEIYEHIYELII